MPKTVSIRNSDAAAETPEKESRAPLSIRQAQAICRGYIAEINRAEKYSEDNPIARASLYETVQELTEQPTQIGSVDDFHNLAAGLGSNGFDSLACDILDCALARFPMDVDLLADYLIYGIDCERLPACAKHFATLESIPQSEWSWRCFAFGIAYSKRLGDSMAANAAERAQYKKKAAALARAYKKYLPYEESGYREAANLATKDPDARLALLNDVLANEKIGSCPACAFEKAEILFKRKKYAEALEAIDRSLEDSVTDLRVAIKENYLLLLRGLCRYAMLLQDLRRDVPLREDTVLAIYADFNKALRDLEDNYQVRIRARTLDLVESTSIPVPDTMERLLDLIE